MRAAFHGRRLLGRQNGNSSAADEGVSARSDLGGLDYLDQLPVRVFHPGDEQSIQPRFASRHEHPAFGGESVRQCVVVPRCSVVVKVAIDGHERADRQAEQGSEKSRG